MKVTSSEFAFVLLATLTAGCTGVASSDPSVAQESRPGLRGIAQVSLSDGVTVASDVEPTDVPSHDLKPTEDAVFQFDAAEAVVELAPLELADFASQPEDPEPAPEELAAEEPPKDEPTKVAGKCVADPTSQVGASRVTVGGSFEDLGNLEGELTCTFTTSCDFTSSTRATCPEGTGPRADAGECGQSFTYGYTETFKFLLEGTLAPLGTSGWGELRDNGKLAAEACESWSAARLRLYDYEEKAVMGELETLRGGKLCKDSARGNRTGDRLTRQRWNLRNYNGTTSASAPSWKRSDKNETLASGEADVAVLCSKELRPNPPVAPAPKKPWACTVGTVWNEETKKALYGADYTGDALLWGVGSAFAGVYDYCPIGGFRGNLTSKTIDSIVAECKSEKDDMAKVACAASLVQRYETTVKGVCRHMSSSLETVLEKLGFSASQIAFSIHRKEGHVVVRVKIDGKDYVVDPMHAPTTCYPME